jgi:probable rRNA maturation factor
VVRRSGSAAALRAPLKTLVTNALTVAGHSAGAITLVLSDDAELRALNRQWRGHDRATDVLSFPEDDSPGKKVGGELILSMDRAREQARRFRVTPGEELARLVIHGALHLAGHDHMKTGERRAMRAAEAAALAESRTAIRALDRALRTIDASAERASLSNA